MGLPDNKKKSLQELGLEFGTNKSSATHNYLEFYETLLASYKKNDSFILMEIGCYKGAGLNTFAKYFPNASVIGIDTNIKRIDIQCDNITVLQCNALNSKQLAIILKKYRPHVIIEDASHHWSHQISIFEICLQYLQPGGIYICEGMHVSFGSYREHRYRDQEIDSASYFSMLSLVCLNGGNINTHPFLSEQLLSDDSVKLARMIDNIIFRKHCVAIAKKQQPKPKPLEEWVRSDPWLSDFTGIFANPFTAVDYKDTPEVIEQIHYCGPEKISQSSIIYELGITPKETSFICTQPNIPDIFAYRIHDAMVYNLVPYSTAGGFFLDAARNPHGKIKKTGKPANIEPKDLGNGSFVLQEGALIKRTNIYPEPSMCFQTRGGFGHFLLECIPDLWVLEKGIKPKLITGLSPKKHAPHKFILDMLSPFGMGENDFIRPVQHEAALAKKFFICTRSSVLGVFVSESAKNIFRRIAEFHHEKQPDNFLKKIYLSRKNYLRRQLINEDACENLFKKYGFTIITPETLPYSEQIRLFSNASHIAGPVGSALHNIVFSLTEKVNLLVMMPENFSAPGFWAIEHSYGRKLCCVTGAYCRNQSDLSFSWKMSLKNLDYALKQWLDLTM
jgi:Capsular polysaccharide biosynthesis protein